MFSANHNHRPCRWFAQAPLGPITSRAYRLIEFSFYCMMRPTAIEIAAWRILLFTSLDYLPFLIAPYQLLSRLVPRFARIFFLGIAKAFWNHRHCRWFSLYNKIPPQPGFGLRRFAFAFYCSRTALSRMRFVTLASRMLYSTAAANASS